MNLAAPAGCGGVRALIHPIFTAHGKAAAVIQSHLTHNKMYETIKHTPAEQ